MSEQRAIGLAHREPCRFTDVVIRFGDVQRQHAVVMPGQDRTVGTRVNAIGQKTKAQAAPRLGLGRQVQAVQGLQQTALRHLDLAPSQRVAGHRKIRDDLGCQARRAEDLGDRGHPVAADLVPVRAGRLIGQEDLPARLEEQRGLAGQAKRILEIDFGRALGALETLHVTSGIAGRNAPGARGFRSFIMGERRGHGQDSEGTGPGPAGAGNRKNRTVSRSVASG